VVPPGTQAAGGGIAIPSRRDRACCGVFVRGDRTKASRERHGDEQGGEGVGAERGGAAQR